MLDMMKKEKKVDIYNLIYKLRSQRNLLVQSLVCVLSSVLVEEFDVFDSGDTEIRVCGTQVCTWSNLYLVWTFIYGCKYFTLTIFPW